MAILFIYKGVTVIIAKTLSSNQGYGKSIDSFSVEKLVMEYFKSDSVKLLGGGTGRRFVFSYTL